MPVQIEQVVSLEKTFRCFCISSLLPAPKTSAEFRTKFVDPESNRFVADGNIALSEKIFHISNAEIEPIVKPNGMLNDGRRESMSFVDVVHRDMLPEGQLICQYPSRAAVNARSSEYYVPNWYGVGLRYISRRNCSVEIMHHAHGFEKLFDEYFTRMKRVVRLLCHTYS